VIFADLWQSLLANLAVLAMLVLAWAHFQSAITRWPLLAQQAGFGIVMGVGAVVVMQFSIEVREGGLVFDLRNVAISLAGVFAGPVGAVIAVAAAAVQRLLIGGDGAIPGIVIMGVIAVISVGCYYLVRLRPLTLRFLLAFGALSSVVSTTGVLVAALRVMPEYDGSVGIPMMLLTFVSFVFGGIIMLHETRERQLRAELDASQALFGHALAEMSDGIAMFDADKRLVFSNEQYRSYFPRTQDVRVPGSHFRDILRAVIARGEQLGPPETDAEAWLTETMGLLDSSSEEEVQLFDGRWLSLRTRPAADGSCMVVVSDLTRRKRDERNLREMASRLQLLASTDGLTGIGNRRAFDAALARETTIAARNNQPLSVLLVDIDWFKSFNDQYGHLVGDRCLRAIAHTLRDVIKGPSDLVARYGGEEFVALLPGVAVDSAFEFAEAFAQSVRARGIEHAGSPKGIVTASVGLACWDPSDDVGALADLVPRADEALYRAKSTGRDRICSGETGRSAVAGAA
jgi:diguanylate cyclase (GGDEF)-like protein